MVQGELHLGTNFSVLSRGHALQRGDSVDITVVFSPEEHGSQVHASSCTMCIWFACCHGPHMLPRTLLKPVSLPCMDQGVSRIDSQYP